MCDEVGSSDGGWMRLRHVGLAMFMLAGSFVLSGIALSAGSTVNIVDFAFDPTNVTVPVGSSITWNNMGSVSHTATANNGSFDTGLIGAGSSKTIAFGVAGTYAYHCSVHPSMTGTVTVTSAVATPSPSPAPTAPPPPTTQPPTPPPSTPAPTIAPTAAPTIAATA